MNIFVPTIEKLQYGMKSNITGLNKAHEISLKLVEQKCVELVLHCMNRNQVIWWQIINNLNKKKISLTCSMCIHTLRPHAYSNLHNHILHMYKCITVKND